MDLDDENDENARKFNQILDSSMKQIPLSEINSVELYKEVLDFVLDNVKTNRLLEEISQDALLEKDLLLMSEDACFQHFCSIAKTTCTPVCLVTSQILAQHLFDAVKPQQNKNIGGTFHHLLSDEKKCKVKTLLDVINKIHGRGTNYFDKVNFIKYLPRKEIPMELIWLLNEKSVVSFRTCLLSWCTDDRWLEKFYECIVSVSCHGDQDDIAVREQLLQVFIGELLLISYGKAEENEVIAEKTRKILFKVVQHTDAETENLTSEQVKHWLCLYKVISDLNDVPTDIIHTFFHEVLFELFAKPCNEKIEDIVASQDKWTFEFLPETTRTKYLQFVRVLNCDEVIQTSRDAVESVKSETVNIQVLCHLLTVFLVHIEESYKLFDDFLGQCLSECVENCDMSQFHLILLLRRLASLEGTHISASYSTWFEQTFVKNGHSLGLNTKKIIHFFCKSLSELVPHEKPEFLKVHIFKCPQVDSKLKHYVDDYVALAKTRLADLNVPLEDNTGLFARNSSSLSEEQTQVMKQAKCDVEKCLTLYEQSGRIPTTIMEASIFRKPYFVGRFLPALLVPRNLELEADTRARLIDDLNRAGKIPTGMFKSYKRKCEQFEDFSNNNEAGDIVQELNKSLEKLPNLLLAPMATEADVTKGLQSWLSAVSRKLKLIFGTRSQEYAHEILDLDVAALNMNPDFVQASYAIMNVFCRACAAVQNVGVAKTVALTRTLGKLSWVAKFASLLISFPCLIQSLYVHLWSSLCHEPQSLSQEHIHGLAILVCHLSCFKPSYNIRSHAATGSTCYETYVDFLASEMSLSSKISAQFFLRWSCYYLQYAMVEFETLTTDLTQLSNDGKRGLAYVPKTMLLKLEYLFSKLKFKADNRTDSTFTEHKEILTLLITSLRDNGLIQAKSDLCFKQWLVWEVNICEDILVEDERQQYYNWTVYENFMSITNDSKDDVSRGIAREIMSTILDRWASPREMGGHRPRYSTETNLLKILQDIVSLFQEKFNGVWFLEFFNTRISKMNGEDNPSSEIHLRTETMAFVRLATQLPPWLLIANAETEWESLNLENTKKFSDFVNKNSKPWLFQGSFVLSFDITAHVLKIFMQHLKTQDRDLLRKREDIFQFFITKTPFVVGSLIYYWEQLKPIHLRHLEYSETLQRIQKYHVWLTRMLNTTGEPSDHHKLSKKLVFNEVGQAYAIFLQLLKSIESTISDVKDLTHRLDDNILDGLKDLQSGKRMIIYLFDAIMAHMAARIMQEDQKKHEEIWLDIAAVILFRSSEVLCVFTQELNKDSDLSSARSILFKRKSHIYLPVAFFRIILRQERIILQQKLPSDVFTQTTAFMYSEFTNLYQNVSDSSEATSSRKLLDLDMFLKITRFVKDYLNRVHPAVLQRIPQSIVARLPKEIRRYFTR